MFVVVIHDLFVKAEAAVNKPLVTSEAPLIVLRFHDGPKPGRDGKERMPDPTMRFGLLMRRQDGNGGFVDLTDDDLSALAKDRQPADLDRYKRLTFDDWGRSNNTCLKIDGTDHLFGDSTGKWVTQGRSRWATANRACARPGASSAPTSK